MSKAVGILEVYGLTSAFVAADAACKAADVTLENFDKNKPANADKLPVPLLVTIKVRGDVSAVQMAIKKAREVAESMTGVVAEHIIPNPETDTEKMLKLSGLDKK
ncbi:MAG: BMC domain-containing protein [Clostridia bacterium]|nr:BMC domain-containing protein [Clostridia bacterium]